MHYILLKLSQAVFISFTTLWLSSKYTYVHFLYICSYLLHIHQKILWILRSVMHLIFLKLKVSFYVYNEMSPRCFILFKLSLQSIINFAIVEWKTLLLININDINKTYILKHLKWVCVHLFVIWEFNIKRLYNLQL